MQFSNRRRQVGPGMSTLLEAAYSESLTDPVSFWGRAAENVHWYRRWDRVLDESNPPFFRWFTGGLVNSCYNALDLHVSSGRAEQLALVYDSPLTDTIQSYTYRALLEKVARFAGVLLSLGVEKGDRVIIYMPMVPEAVVTMLACARIGAVQAVVFGGFAANELATRIDAARPKVVVAASCGIEPGRVVAYKPLLDQAIDIAESEAVRCIVLQRPHLPCEMVEGRDLDWEELMVGAEPAQCVPVSATDPLYILYTSGTTGMPKGVVRDNGGHLVALKWSMDAVYGMAEGDVYWAASDVGWVVGHSYIVYAPLFKGCTTIIYEGKPVGTPDPGAFWRVISEHGVNALFTAPTVLRALKRDDSKGEYLRPYDLSSFRALFLAGERCDPDTLRWAERRLSVPVLDHWWQTETGWAIGANCVGLGRLPVKPGSCTKPVPGYDVRILQPEGGEAPPNQVGDICVRLPLPPGCMSTLWNQDERFIESYLSAHPGYYQTADAGYVDEDGYLFVMGRTDDIINVAGHRLSTGAMEEVLASHNDVAECAVVGANDPVKGEVPIGLAVLKTDVTRSESNIISELVQMVRESIGPVASFKVGAIVTRLPKTRSGKILRGTIKKIGDGVEHGVPPTIDDPAILGEIAECFKRIGYPIREE